MFFLMVGRELCEKFSYFRKVVCMVFKVDFWILMFWRKVMGLL